MKTQTKKLILISLIVFSSLTFSQEASASTVTKTLYAWARDLAGNISAYLSDSIDITLPDGTTYYLSPSGSDTTGDGSIGNPWFSLNKAWQSVVAGDTVYMRGGTYAYTTQQVMQGKNGTSSSNMINLFAYPGETPVISKGSPYVYNNDYGYGAYLSGDYIYFKGLTFSGYTQETEHVWFALRVYGNHNIFEQLNVHHNGAGMLISGDSTDNLVLNSDFHHNSDPLSPIPYNNGDGLGIAYITSGNTNTVDGCRFWWNVDDGLDLYNNEGNVIVRNSWSFYNGFLPDTFTNAREELGDGNGFKLGDQQEDHGSEILRTLTNNLLYRNRSSGIFINEAKTQVVAHNNSVYLNGYIGMHLNSVGYVHDVKNNTSYQNYYNGCISEGSVVSNNTFISCNVSNPSYTVSDDDFVSLNSSALDDARQSDGSLPSINFLHLVSGSDLINTGIDVGLPYNGSAPDLGAFETSY